VEKISVFNFKTAEIVFSSSNIDFLCILDKRESKI